jgi:hypothetical protein
VDGRTSSRRRSKFIARNINVHRVEEQRSSRSGTMIIAWKDDGHRKEARCSWRRPFMRIVTTREQPNDDHEPSTLGRAMFQTMITSLPRVTHASSLSRSTMFYAKKSDVHRLPKCFSKLGSVVLITMNIARPKQGRSLVHARRIRAAGSDSRAAPPRSPRAYASKARPPGPASSPASERSPGFQHGKPSLTGDASPNERRSGR